MAFDDPGMRSEALRQIEVLRRLVDDLTGIIDGSRPTLEELASAPQLHDYQLAHRKVPCIIGFSAEHPTIRPGPMVTSQLFVLDPDRRWARTLSRFYRLAQPRKASLDGELQ